MWMRFSHIKYFNWIVPWITPSWCGAKLHEASWTLDMIKWIEDTRAGFEYVRSTKGAIVTRYGESRKLANKTKSCLAVVGQTGRLKGAEGGAGQAGATWLEERDEVWVLEKVAAASLSSNGFFPQHTVVIMQFLNWKAQKKIRVFPLGRIFTSFNEGKVLLKILPS